MSDYIEREDEETTSTTTTTESEDEKIKAERWNWLLNSTTGWNAMSFKEKMKIFLPSVAFIYPNDDLSEVEYCKCLEDKLAEFVYYGCRLVDKILYDVNNRTTPTWTVVLKPVQIEFIPDTTIKAAVYEWGIKWGFISTESVSKSVDESLLIHKTVTNS